MKCVKVDLPRTHEKAEVLILSDWHIGSRKVRYKELQSRVKYIQENEDVYCVLLGDLINNATIDSVSDSYEEELTPQQQINSMANILMPIKDKILAAVQGNHENRTKKKSGIDITYNAMAQLGKTDIYDPISVLLFLRLGTLKSGFKESNGSGKTRQCCYSLYISHGSGGGSTIGGKANALKKRGDIVNADIMVCGHTHQTLIFPLQKYEIDYRNNSVTPKLTYFVNADALLDYESYAEQYGFPPSASINPIITLQGGSKRINITI